MMCAPTHSVGTPNYRRVVVPGGTYFFTVNLLRGAFRATKAARPFPLQAIVVLPDAAEGVGRGGVAVCGMAGSSPPYEG